MIGDQQTQSGSCRGEHRRGSPQIVGAARQDRLHLVSDHREEPHTAQAIALLEHRKRPLHAGTNATDQPIAPRVWRWILDDFSAHVSIPLSACQQPDRKAGFASNDLLADSGTSK